MTRAELLDQINAFSCPDGSGVWSRGNDLPDELRDPIRFEGLVTLLSRHMSLVGIPNSDHENLLFPKEGMLNPEYANLQILSSEELGIWVKLLDDGIVLPPKLIRRVQKVLQLRGESLPDRYLHLIEKSNNSKR